MSRFAKSGILWQNQNQKTQIKQASKQDKSIVKVVVIFDKTFGQSDVASKQDKSDVSMQDKSHKKDG